MPSQYSCTWHIDSGASNHISNLRSSFSQIKRLPKPIRIRIGNDSIIIALKIGSVPLTTVSGTRTHNIVLTNVLYAPEIGTNLVSVSRLQQKGCDIIFPCGGNAFITDRNDAWLGTVLQKSGMYCLSIKQQSQTKKSKRQALVSTTQPLPLQLWY
jgi:hypothetical protein